MRLASACACRRAVRTDRLGWVGEAGDAAAGAAVAAAPAAAGAAAAVVAVVLPVRVRGAAAGAVGASAGCGVLNKYTWPVGGDDVLVADAAPRGRAGVWWPSVGRVREWGLGAAGGGGGNEDDEEAGRYDGDTAAFLPNLLKQGIQMNANIATCLPCDPK